MVKNIKNGNNIAKFLYYPCSHKCLFTNSLQNTKIENNILFKCNWVQIHWKFFKVKIFGKNMFIKNQIWFFYFWRKHSFWNVIWCKFTNLVKIGQSYSTASELFGKNKNTTEVLTFGILTWEIFIDFINFLN